MKVNILGASGAVGTELLNLMLADPDISEINYLSRKNLSIDNSRLNPVVFSELSDAINQAPLANVWFCTLGSTMAKAGSKEAFEWVDRTLVVMAAKKAMESGAAQFHVVSALGANSGSTVYYNRIKGKMEEDLKNLNLNALHIYRPSLIDTDRKESRWGERTAIVLFRIISWLFVGPLKRYKAIKAYDIARFMLKQAKNENSGVNIWNSEQMQP